jgi:hypothetical protein
MNTRTERIGTRIGPIEVQNGYPSQSAAKALYDELDFQRASQAYLWALPAVGFYGLHLAHLRTFGAQDGDVVLYQTLKDKAGMLTPNLTTTYAMSFWNMAEKGPLVIEVPAGATAGGVLDLWQRPVTDTGYYPRAFGESDADALAIRKAVREVLELKRGLPVIVYQPPPTPDAPTPDSATQDSVTQDE